MILVEDVVDENGVTALLEKARVDSIWVAAHWNEVCVTAWQNCVVSERCYEPTAGGKSGRHELTQWCDCCVVGKVRKSVTHAQDEIRFLVRRQVLSKPQEVGDDGFDGQSFAERAELLQQMGWGIDGEHAISRARVG
jgi:hypothetical protein